MRILSVLAYWSPIFAEVDFMPTIVIAFLKIIPNDDLLVVELVMALIV